MNKIQILISSLGFVILLATAAWSETISPPEAAYHVGEQVTVAGVVSQVSVSGKGTIFVNFGGRFPNHVFYAVIFAKYARSFKDVHALEGRSVAIDGVVKMYKGKPEIILTSPDQISLN